MWPVGRSRALRTRIACIGHRVAGAGASGTGCTRSVKESGDCAAEAASSPGERRKT